MCSISVDPMPSTMSTSKCRLKRSPRSAGSASPGRRHDAQRHVADATAAQGEASIAAKPVGAP
jgi:hypothetical protein